MLPEESSEQKIVSILKGIIMPLYLYAVAPIKIQSGNILLVLCSKDIEAKTISDYTDQQYSG